MLRRGRTRTKDVVRNNNELNGIRWPLGIRQLEKLPGCLNLESRLWTRRSNRYRIRSAL